MNHNNEPLGVHENQAIIQARIEGLSEQQVQVVNRLRFYGISPNLVIAAINAEPDSTTYEAAENAIIEDLRRNRDISEEDALLLLNGKETFTSLFFKSK